MSHSTDTAPTVWHALDTWAAQLKPWQRQILAYATRSGTLGDKQIDEVYCLFLEEMGLREKAEHEEIALDVSGRPASVLTKQLRLERIDGLAGVNALPEGCSLEFGPALTVVYGRNGAGKSGFARLVANACFSRHKPEILPNIYDDKSEGEATANFHITIDGVAQTPLLFSFDEEHEELRRISFFDIDVARLHISETASFEFKPSGFDVFPEMARVYGKLAAKLEADISSKTREAVFYDAFIGSETEVTRAVAAVDTETDLKSLEALAVYGPAEKARLKEIDAQVTALKSKSSKELIASRTQARADVNTLNARLIALAGSFAQKHDKRRSALSEHGKEAADAAKLLGTKQFKRPFFRAVGTPEWEEFAAAAHDLARKEKSDYPAENDRCLLCERPLKGEARKHVEALLSFVEGDAQTAADDAASAIDDEIDTLQQLETNIFSPDSRVREHVSRLEPTIEKVVESAIRELNAARKSAVAALRKRAPCKSSVDVNEAQRRLAKLLKRIDGDLKRLAKDDSESAIASLDLERQTLRHREILKQQLPHIRKYIEDTAWCAKAKRAKSCLNSRQITDKEKSLSSEIIGGAYKTRLALECEGLDCRLPIELQMIGERGETVRSLSIEGGYQPQAILSEGEQKAVALADFLTEVGLNPTNASIVLDDPVTSQDHERKQRIAQRLVDEAKQRQVIVFTHDLPFLNQLIGFAEESGVDVRGHWVDRDNDGNPGRVVLDDVPATSKVYDTTDKARSSLAEAQKLTGTPRHDAIRKGMAALRRTIEETVVKRLFKGAVPRWSDRVMVTTLRKVAWDNELADQLVDMYEELSAYMEGHSHTDEASGAPPEINDLETRITAVDVLIKRAKADRVKESPSAGSPARP